MSIQRFASYARSYAFVVLTASAAASSVAVAHENVRLTQSVTGVTKRPPRRIDQDRVGLED